MKFSALLLVLVLGIAGCVQYGPPATQATPVAAPTTTVTPAAATLSTHTVNITASGFSPKELTIKAGDTVTWVNKNTAPHWPASAVHPTHKAYPGSDIAKCGTADASTIFDACKGLAQGESFKFTFNSKGTWFYHDHLNPSLFGKIVVE